ncbi:cysteine hydrolase family protein [Paeniglutamicibacter antarcticus]|uniref:Cysteine hydrolase family protein n=1 Tax=Paeniglutamicibacter antarcticus TaxID=494023 RepID=A0ABP9TN55_9MICC
MSTFPDRERTALLVIDMQNDVVSDAYRREETLANINALVDRARESGTPVVWVQHSDAEMETGSTGWQIVPELAPQPGEPVIQKIYGDSFEDTTLEEVLAAAGAGRLVVSGAQSDACIRSTVHGAFTRGYDVTLVSDAHTTSDMTQWGAPAPESAISHINLYWQFQGAPGRTAAVTTAEDVVFGT